MFYKLWQATHPPPRPAAIVCKTLGFFLVFLGQFHDFDQKHWDYWDSSTFSLHLLEKASICCAKLWFLLSHGLKIQNSMD